MEKEPKQNFTEQTYDKSARWYAEKFKGIGVRAADVDMAFSFTSIENPSVVEIGCGAGREAEYILTKTDTYVGMDISEGMLQVARENLPDARFEKADVATYEFPQGVDIVFAFASLLHSNKGELKSVLENIYEALSESGVVYVSLKRKSEYSSAIIEDAHGPRKFYYYTQEAVLAAAGEGFEEVFYEEQELAEPWFTMILKKK
jgi:trans-aconitate methyltransferase